MTITPGFSDRFAACEAIARVSLRGFTACLVATTEMAHNPISVTTMLGVSIIGRIREAANRFAGANQGNIAVIFAIAPVPLISFVGAASIVPVPTTRARACGPRSTRLP